jgi:hypothetical protein
VFVAAQERDSPDRAFLRNNTVAAGAGLYRLYCGTTISHRNGSKFPDFGVAHIIGGYEATAALGSREMPIWGDFFHDMQRDDMLLRIRGHNPTEYIRSIQRWGG